MKCVFLDESEYCHAELTKARVTWKVDEETKKDYCTTKDFEECPRFHAKMLSKGLLQRNRLSAGKG